MIEWWKLPLVFVLTSPPALAHGLWSTTTDRPYDVVAQCIAHQMRPLYHVDPGVSAPPRRTALVQLWPRPYQPGQEPVAVFRVAAMPTPMGGVGIVLDASRRFPHYEQAKEAGRWCGRFAL